MPRLTAGHNRSYSDPKKSEYKLMAREQNVKIYREKTGNYTIPKNLQYWTLCNLQPDVETSEINQLVNLGLITKNQFHGIDNDPAYIDKNKEYHPEANWYAGDWTQVIRSNIESFKPALVYLDTTSLLGYSESIRLLETTMRFCNRGTVLLFNVMGNNPRGKGRFPWESLVEKINLSETVLDKWCNYRETENIDFELYDYDVSGLTEMFTYVFHRKDS